MGSSVALGAAAAVGVLAWATFGESVYRPWGPLPSAWLLGPLGGPSALLLMAIWVGVVAAGLAPALWLLPRRSGR